MGKVFKAIGNIFGGGKPQVVYMPAPTVPMEDPAKKQEEKTQEENRRKQATDMKGLSSTILGGAAGSEQSVNKKKLLGE